MRIKQQLHKYCGGELVVTKVKNNNLGIVCKKCKLGWEFDGADIKINKDWRDIKKGEY